MMHGVSTQDIITHVLVVCDIKKDVTIKSSEFLLFF